MNDDLLIKETWCKTMDRIHLECGNFHARFACTPCSHCSSKIGISLNRIKNRGCCSYFPVFDLTDIHKFVKLPNGIRILSDIMSDPRTDVYHYYIHAKGFFDKKSYENYIKYGGEDYGIKDKTLLFRTCPFVKSGAGCTLKPEYRHFVCNFFICGEIISKIKNTKTFKQYQREMLRYSRWNDWENQSLRAILSSHHLSLLNNLDDTIKFLRTLPYDMYEFPRLDDIYFDYDPGLSDINA